MNLEDLLLNSIVVIKLDKVGEDGYVVEARPWTDARDSTRRQLRVRVEFGCALSMSIGINSNLYCSQTWSTLSLSPPPTSCSLNGVG